MNRPEVVNDIALDAIVWNWKLISNNIEWIHLGFGFFFTTDTMSPRALENSRRKKGNRLTKTGLTQCAQIFDTFSRGIGQEDSNSLPHLVASLPPDATCAMQRPTKQKLATNSVNSHYFLNKTMHDAQFICHLLRLSFDLWCLWAEYGFGYFISYILCQLFDAHRLFRSSFQKINATLRCVWQLNIEWAQKLDIKC